MGVAGGSGLPAAAIRRTPAGEATVAEASGNTVSESGETAVAASTSAGRRTSPPTAGAGSASAGGGAGDGERGRGRGGAAGDSTVPPLRGRLSQPRGESQPEPPPPAGLLAASAARALRMPASPGRRRGAPGAASSPSPSDTVPLAAEAAATSPGVHRTRWRGAPPETEYRERGRRLTERPPPSSPSPPLGAGPAAARPVGGRRPARSAVDAGSADV